MTLPEVVIRRPVEAPTDLPPAAGRGGRPAHRRRRRGDASPCRRTCARRSRSGPASTSPCAARDGDGGPALVLDLLHPARARRARTSADRRQAGARRRLLRLRVRRHVRAGDAVDVLPPLGHFTTDFDAGPAEALRARSPPGRGSRRCCRWSPPRWTTEPGSRFTLLYGNRYAAQRDVRRGAGRPEGPLPGPAAPGARALPRAAGADAALRSPRRGPAGRASSDALRRSVRQWTNGSSAARTAWCSTPRRCSPSGRADAPSTPSCSMSTTSRRPPARAADATPRRTTTVTIVLDGRDVDLRPWRPDERVLDAALQGAAGAAVRVQGRGLLDLPGEGGRRAGRDGPQLRPGTGRDWPPATF